MDAARDQKSHGHGGVVHRLGLRNLRLHVWLSEALHRGRLCRRSVFTRIQGDPGRGPSAGLHGLETDRHTGHRRDATATADRHPIRPHRRGGDGLGVVRRIAAVVRRGLLVPQRLVPGDGLRSGAGIPRRAPPFGSLHHGIVLQFHPGRRHLQDRGSPHARGRDSGTVDARRGGRRVRAAAVGLRLDAGSNPSSGSNGCDRAHGETAHGPEGPMGSLSVRIFLGNSGWLWVHRVPPRCSPGRKPG